MKKYLQNRLETLGAAVQAYDAQIQQLIANRNSADGARQEAQLALAELEKKLSEKPAE